MLVYLYIVVFASLIDHSTIAPIISSYARSLGASERMAGLIAGVYSIAALVSYPVIGFLLDRFSRVRVLISFYITDLLLIASYLFVKNPLELLIVRSLHGFVDASIFPSALAIFRDVIRTRFGMRFSLYWVIAATPILIGNLVTRILVVRLGFWSVYIFVLLVMFLGFLSVTRMRVPYEEIHRSYLELRVLEEIKIPRSLVLISYLSALNLYMMIGVIVGSMSSLLIRVYNMSREIAAAEVATWSLISSLTSIPLIILITSRLLENLKRSVVGVLIGLFSILLSSGILMISIEPVNRYTSSMIFGLALALILPTTSKIVTDLSHKIRGRASAALGASYLLGVAIGAPLSSRLLGVGAGYNLNFTPPLILSTVLTLYLLVYLLLRKI
ncbi:MAG: MFS transporter [Sulfolobales archaeon]